MNPNLTCGNCLLYDPRDGMCSVQVMYAGELLQIGVRPEDKCHWQAMGIQVQELKTPHKKDRKGNA